MLRDVRITMTDIQNITNKINDSYEVINGWYVSRIIGNYYLCIKDAVSDRSGKLKHFFPFRIDLNKSLLFVTQSWDYLSYVNTTDISDTHFVLDNNSNLNDIPCTCQFLLYRQI